VAKRSKWTKQAALWLNRLAVLLLLVLLGPACDSGGTGEEPSERDPILNLGHLDHLLEVVERGGVSYGIVHIYAEAPDYEWVHDDDEGAAALDDAARAAVVYLRHFELHGDDASRLKAEALLRFTMYMQTEEGLFYNFVWDSALEINTTHQNSVADDVSFWAARGVWALGTCARVLKQVNAPLSEACARRAERIYPHLDALLVNYGRTLVRNGRTYPLWLIGETGSDATSELLLGLTALRAAYPDPDLDVMIGRFAEGIEMMRYGDAATFPYGAHASWLETWHGWGNSQTQALADAGRTQSAIQEADQFYPRLLVEGWLHSMDFANPGSKREYEQIAYATRGVAVGLARLFDRTGDEKYAKLAGIAASWFTGNNAAGVAMYDPETGRGYDGISGPNQVNYNAGAESTIEALHTILEVERHPLARTWMYARGGNATAREKGGKQYTYRIFTAGDDSLAIVLNLTDKTTIVLEGAALEEFLR
ncbi:MAG: hypothetical protein WD275_08940, partial [Rhodothermales bacterium]